MTMPTPPAEPVAPQTPQPIVINNQPPAEQYFTATQLEAARQQEKDKVYARITKAEEETKAFKAQIDELSAEKATRDAETERLRKEAEDAAKAAAQEKMTAAELITQKEQELTARQEAFENRIAAEQALLKKEQEFLALKSFTQTRIAQEIANDTIAPEFLDYITGETEEEIEASITKAVEKTASIAEGISNITNRQTPGIPRMPGVSPTGRGPTGPLDQFNGQQQQPTQQQIEAMNMAEYAAYRAATGIDKAGKDRGMFS